MKGPILVGSEVKADWVVFAPGMGTRGLFFKLDGPFGYFQWTLEVWDATKLPKNRAQHIAKLTQGIAYHWSNFEMTIPPTTNMRGSIEYMENGQRWRRNADGTISGPLGDPPPFGS